jgi:hypothetical protein
MFGVTSHLEVVPCNNDAMLDVGTQDEIYLKNSHGGLFLLSEGTDKNHYRHQSIPEAAAPQRTPQTSGGHVTGLVSCRRIFQKSCHTM